MLLEIDTSTKTATQVDLTSLASLQLKERTDLQEWVISTPEILGEPLLVITSEYDGFDRTSERLDVLAVDRRGKLVVVELKRTAAGTAAELQALRYAAYCSTLALSDVVDLLVRFRDRREERAPTKEETERDIREFIENPEFDDLDQQPRIILAAEAFSQEITATVLWLRSFGVDVTCVRLRPYQVNGRLVLDSSVLIPLPEAREYVIRRERKEAADNVRDPRPEDANEFINRAPSAVQPHLRQLREWLVQQGDIQEGVYKTLLSYRRQSDRAWITWLYYTSSEARIGIAPSVDIDPSRVIKTGSDGWRVVAVQSADDYEQLKIWIMAGIGTTTDKLSP